MKTSFDLEKESHVILNRSIKTTKTFFSQGRNGEYCREMSKTRCACVQGEIETLKYKLKLQHHAYILAELTT